MYDMTAIQKKIIFNPKTNRTCFDAHAEQCKKRESRCQATSGLSEERQPPTLPAGGPVPSAHAGLTALFGMGKGGSPLQ